MSRLIYKYRDTISILFVLGLLILTSELKPYFKGELVVWSTLMFGIAFTLFLLVVEIIAEKMSNIK